MASSLSTASSSSASAGWQHVDPSQLRDVDTSRLVTVEPAQPTAHYYEEAYSTQASASGLVMRERAKKMGETYGGVMHNVQGNGDCLVNAYAAGLLYRLNGNPALVDQFRATLMALPDESRSHIREHLEEVFGPLEMLKQTSPDVFNEWIGNSSFMKALAGVLREMAYQEALADPAILNDFIDEMASRTPGTEMGAPAVGLISRRLGLRSHSVDISMPGHNDSSPHITPSPDGDDGIPDIVIFRRPGHFFAIIPDGETMKRHGYQPRPPLERRVEEVALERIAPPASPASLAERAAPATPGLLASLEANKYVVYSVALFVIIGALYLGLR